MGGLSPSTDPGARPAPAPRRLPPARVRPPVTGALFCIRQRPRLFIRHRSRAAFSARLFCVPPAPAAPGPLACLAAPGPGARFGVRCARFGVRPAPVAYYRHALWRPSPATGARFGTLHALWRPVAAFHPAQEPGGLFRPALLYPSTLPRLSRRLRPCLSALRPGRLRALVACLAGTRSTPAAHFQFFFLREDQGETGAIG